MFLGLTQTKIPTPIGIEKDEQKIQALKSHLGNQLLFVQLKKILFENVNIVTTSFLTYQNI